LQKILIVWFGLSSPRLESFIASDSTINCSSCR
jgi:hypothetical protein